MRSNFITENRWLLRLCSSVARFFGLLLLLGTGVMVAVMIVVTISGSKFLGATDGSRYEILGSIPAILFTGFVALILGEFIAYLLAEQGEPKWILRHGDKIIYAYVLYATVIGVVTVAGLRAIDREIGGVVSLRECHLALALIIASIIVRMLFWIGIAIVLRKIVPIIREAKTLV